MTGVCVGQILPGSPRLGIWCDHCLLCSRFEVEVFLMTAEGLSTVGIYEGCTENGYEPHAEEVR